MKTSLPMIVICCGLVAACSGGGGAKNTVKAGGATIHGNFTVVSIGGHGGHLQVSPNVALDPKAFGFLFPGKLTGDTVSSEEQSHAEQYCTENPEKCRKISE